MLNRRVTSGLLVAGICLMLAAQGRSAYSAEIQGAGSSFVAPVMSEWVKAYAKLSGVNVTYDSVGSGAGIDRIRSGVVDFGASDKPLSTPELDEAGLCQFPLVVGGIVPVVNIPGVSPGQLKLSGQVLADIFMGRVTDWDAEGIKATNRDTILPTQKITVVHRSDGSGTTYNWTDFLARSSPLWKEKIGVGLTVAWPVGVGGNGNAGVADSVARTPGAIGYVEYSYALASHLAYAQVGNAYGLFISPSADAFQSAAATVNWRRYPNFGALMTNAGGADAYPVTATTFILMYRHPKDPQRSAAALAFFKWALEHGNDEATALNYAPLPGSLVKLVEAYWASEIDGLKTVSGD